MAKRFLDILVSALLLVLLSPLVVVLLLAMALDMLLVAADRGSFLYRETRVSQGRPFALLKFRTLKRAELERLRAEGGHARPSEAEPENLTWAGRRLLKPWYFDEIPQFLNVLRGDMSLVGPRPWPPEMVRRQVAEGLDYRNRVRAGLTGPAQVTKGEGKRYEDLDSDYIERCNRLSAWALVRYDLRILRRTIATIGRGEGLNY